MTMKNILHPEGLQALATLFAGRPLLSFDFDGTLAPIVAIPEDARPPKGVARLLGQLAAHHPVAIITGRSVADVSPRLGFQPFGVVGNHGAEDPTLPPDEHGPEMLDCLRVLLDGPQGQSLKATGVMIEDKGLSMALHYRLAPDPEQACRQIQAMLDSLGPRIDVFGGKMVFNVKTPGSPDKADAALALLRRSGADRLFFIGDDANDEPIFERALPGWLTVRVGHDGASRAAWFLESIADMPTLLDICWGLSQNAVKGSHPSP